jgi:hypothetical protein
VQPFFALRARNESRTRFQVAKGHPENDSLTLNK